MSECTFDPVAHEYRIGTEVVPSVTGIIEEMLQPVFWGATDWHLQRGRAIHACAAMIARGQTFAADPRLEGYCAAVRKFLAECVTECWDIERVMFSEALRFGGTCDLIAETSIKGARAKRVLIDYKASLTNLVGLQLGGYSILDGGTINSGVGVQLNENGTYRLSQVYDLRRERLDFATLRSAYALKQRHGLLNRKQNTAEGEAQ